KAASAPSPCARRRRHFRRRMAGDVPGGTRRCPQGRAPAGRRGADQSSPERDRLSASRLNPWSMSADHSRSGLSLPEKVIAIHRALAASKVPHAIGGAIALAYYAEPRATVDVDVNVFLPTDRWPDLRGALAPLGVDVELDEPALARDGQVRL